MGYNLRVFFYLILKKPQFGINIRVRKFTAEMLSAQNILVFLSVLCVSAVRKSLHPN